MIDDPEFFDIIDAWIAGQIDDSTFFQAIDVWVSQALISSADLNAKPLRLDTIGLSSNSTNHAMLFSVNGQGIAAMRVEIFNLNGLKIFDQEVAGAKLMWNLSTQSEQPIANGTYLYVVMVRGPQHQVIISQVKKLIILR